MVSVKTKYVGRSASQKTLLIHDSRQPNKRKTNRSSMTSTQRSSASSATARSSASRATTRSSASRATARRIPSSATAMSRMVPSVQEPWTVKFPFKMNSNSPIRVGSDCSGLGSEVFALKMLGLSINHRFASDAAQHSKTFIFNNCKPNVWYENCMIRDNQKTPSVDVYVAGFPLPFSSAGKNKGLRDEGRTVFDGIFSTTFIIRSRESLCSRP